MLVHGDDFLSIGEGPDQDYLYTTLKNSYEVKCERIAPTGPVKQMRVLGRIISYTSEGLQLEADPQHAEIAAQMLGLVHAKGSGYPICL